MAGGRLPQAEDNTSVKADKPGHIGHRARLRDRLLKGGAEALADYEVLEYLLFAGMRQGDSGQTQDGNQLRAHQDLPALNSAKVRCL